ncbi:tetratricopeptide repeat protein [Congregicoccus parvus]|uniref:tetratricopeptide repeat protein n=1 Tax=Congregicoccus parvus TaxID=3081749 RepID=UPI003FA60347
MRNSRPFASLLLSLTFGCIAASAQQLDPTEASTPASTDVDTPSSSSIEPNVGASPDSSETPAETEMPAAPAPLVQTVPVYVTPDFTPLLRSNAELLVRLEAFERSSTAQRDREAAIYKDTNRIVTMFAASFAALGVVALTVALVMMFRAIKTLHEATLTAAGRPLGGARSGLLTLAPADGAVPGIEAIQASGSRLDDKMTSLEHRLSEMEHLSGMRTDSPFGEDLVNHPAAAESPVAAASRNAKAKMPSLGTVLLHKAETLGGLGKFEQALYTLERALSEGATQAEVHLARGKVFEQSGRTSDALREYEAAAAADPKSSTALLLKAALLNRQERFEEALVCYERAIELSRPAASPAS